MTYPLSKAAPRCLRAFAFAPAFASPLHYTPWLLLREERCNTASHASIQPSRAFPSARCIPFALHQIVIIWFQALFTTLPGFFSAFARATYSLSVSEVYLGLGASAPVFTLPPGSATHRIPLRFVSLTWLSHSMALLSRRTQLARRMVEMPTSPLHCCKGFSTPFSGFTRRYYPNA